MTKDSPYRLSYTFGGLLVPESRTVAEHYVQTGHWAAVRERVVDGDILRKTRVRTRRRYFGEIRDRLQAAYDWELAVVGGTAPDTAGPLYAERDIPIVLLAIVSRYYGLVGGFLSSVVRTRLFDGLLSIDTDMFRSFLADQEPAHPEIASVSESTRGKLTTVTFRMLREAGIISGRTGPFRIGRPDMSAGLVGLYCSFGTTIDHEHLLWSDKEIRRCMR